MRRPARRRRPRRSLPRVLAVALSSLMLAPRVLAAQQPAFDEGIFEVGVQRVATRLTLTTLVDERGNVLVPLRPIVELVGIPMRLEGTSRVLEWPPGPWRTVLESADRTLEVGGEKTAVPAGEWAERDGQLFLSSATLGRVLDAQVQVDWAGLGILIVPRSEFPATRRLERDAQRERDRLVAERLREIEPDLPFVPRSGGGVGAWGLSLSGANSAVQGAARAAVGGSVLGGATEAGLTAVAGQARDHFDEAYLRFHRAFPGRSTVRQVEVGSVLSDGPVARRLIGATITNEPFTSPHFFAETLIQPLVPAGWEYEVYQGDALVGVSSASDPQDVRAPLNYGNTPVRIRMIGPAGQERTEELLYVVPPTRLQTRQWRYEAGLGACQDPGCTSYGYGQVRAGLSPRVTAGLGLDRIDAAEGSARTRPYATLGLTPLRGLTVDLQAQPHALFQAAGELATAARGNFGASYAWSRPLGDAPTLDGWYAQLSATVPLALLGGRSVASRLQVRGGGVGPASWQLFGATTVRSSYLSAELEAGLQQRNILSAQAFTPVRTSLSSRVRDLAVSVGTGLSARGPELLDLGASFRPTETGSVSLDVRLRRDSPVLLSVGFVARRPQGYFQVRAAQGSGAGLFASADGSVAYDEQAGLMPLPFQSLGRAGVRGVVFLDRNGNGVRDGGEPPAPAVDVLIRGERFTTDSSGAYRSWELLPYDAVAVAVDSLSVDPSWVPAPRSVQLRPSPNLFNPVDLPLRRTREVSGRVEIPAQPERALGGVRLEIRDDAGTLIATPRTFTDGVFYVQRLAPGRYTVAVAASSLDALGVRGTGPQGFDLTPDTEEPLELPPLRLEPGGGR